MAVASALLIIVITILCEHRRAEQTTRLPPAANLLTVPPAGAWAVSGCGMGKLSILFTHRASPRLLLLP